MLCLLACGDDHPSTHHGLDGGDAGSQPTLDAYVPYDVDAANDANVAAHDDAGPPSTLRVFYTAGPETTEQLYRSSATESPLAISDSSPWQAQGPFILSRDVAISLDGNFAAYGVLSNSGSYLALRLVHIQEHSVEAAIDLAPTVAEGRRITCVSMRAHAAGMSLLYTTDALSDLPGHWELFWVEVDLEGHAAAPVRLHPGKTSTAQTPIAFLTNDGAAYFEADLGDGEQTYWTKLAPNATYVQLSPAEVGSSAVRTWINGGSVSLDGKVFVQYARQVTAPPATRLYANEFTDAGPGLPLRLADWPQSESDERVGMSPDGHVVASLLADDDSVGVYRFAQGVVTRATKHVPTTSGQKTRVQSISVSPSQQVLFTRKVDDAYELWTVDASSDAATDALLLGHIDETSSGGGWQPDGPRIPDSPPSHERPVYLHRTDGGVSFSLLDTRTHPPSWIDLTSPFMTTGESVSWDCAASLGTCIFAPGSASAPSTSLYRYDPNAAQPTALSIDPGGPVDANATLQLDDAQQAGVWYAGDGMHGGARVLDLTSTPPGVAPLQLPVDSTVAGVIAFRRTR